MRYGGLYDLIFNVLAEVNDAYGSVRVGEGRTSCIRNTSQNGWANFLPKHCGRVDNRLNIRGKWRFQSATLAKVLNI